MCSLFAASAWCLARPNALSSTAVAVASFLWLALSGPLEGRVLYVFNPGHGLTESDLLSFVGFGIAAWGFWASYRRYKRGGPGRWL
ncbi:hypothetical protein JYA75_10735 [Rhodococcus sp. PSBB066]|nr:intracellular growth attenuator family protein [Rhodococcus ruber]NCL78302.1 hypothetical protein [Rhodococcus sp. YH1]QRI77945.1 hypothetical protein JQ505_09625 [Rhodococcus aetherivorans]QSE61361.1 hypothetical protein JYA75_10735 [Rhodococcus sp. PSBB066]QSE67328.1 hypothetical protein JYA91_16855 [Rhodococcus sp. PSBB049]